MYSINNYEIRFVFASIKEIRITLTKTLDVKGKNSHFIRNYKFIRGEQG